MDKITEIKERVRKNEWAEKIRECRESGLTVTEWCNANGINPKTYYYHLRKMRTELCEQIPVPVMSIAEKIPSIKIVINGIEAEITDGVSEQTITAVIRAINNA